MSTPQPTRDPAAALALLAQLFEATETDKAAAHLVGALLGRVMMRDVLARAALDPEFALRCIADLDELTAQLTRRPEPAPQPAKLPAAAKAA